MRETIIVTHADTSTDEPVKIGFLYNHEELHQVAHTAPIIAELQKLGPAFEIGVLFANDAQAQAVEGHLDPQFPKPVFRHLKERRIVKFAERLVGGAIPLGRVDRLAANLDVLGDFDVLTVPETTSTMLKTRFGLTKPKLVFCPHGAGDRSISISPEMAHFDYILMPGEKTRDRMVEAGIAGPDSCAIVGYPKFNSRHLAQSTRFFANDRPTVLYNPHFDPQLSSWYDFGLDILDYFAAQDSYNLVVAPHVMLFQRRITASIEHRKLRWRRDIPAKYFGLENILIDKGSSNSVDMTYTRNADIYLGDVSSQIYEFIERPRPAVFLNSHNANWQGDPNYSFWNLGPVVSDIAGLGSALASADPLTDQYRQAQDAAFRQTFSVDDNQSAASRAAEAIADFATRDRS